MKKNKVIKVSITIISILLVLFIAAGLFVGNMFFNIALNPSSENSMVSILNSHEPEITEEYLETQKKYNESVEWLEKVSDDIYISSDGLKLHAYLVKNETPSSKWVMLFHGYGGDAREMAIAGMRFYSEGYNLLLPDARCFGESDGEYIGMGWPERLDALKWMDGIISEDKNAEIMLYGVSMGGATVMMISGEDLPPNVKVVVEDCGYTSAWDEFSYQLNQMYSLPQFPIVQFANLVTKIRAGYFFSEASALEQVKKSKTPTMFIHGDADKFVPTYMVNELYAASNVEKTLLIAKGAEHGLSRTVLGEAYWEEVFSFVHRFI